MDKENFRAAKSINVYLNGDPYTSYQKITLPKRLETAKVCVKNLGNIIKGSFLGTGSYAGIICYDDQKIEGKNAIP